MDLGGSLNFMATLNTCPFSASMIICFFNWGGLAPSTSLRLPGPRLWFQLPPYLFSLRGFTHPWTPTCCVLTSLPLGSSAGRCQK